MVLFKMIYQGDLRVAATHGPSGASLHTDAPVDNHGKGESFSPTDLVATGLGSCMATVMGIHAQKENLDLKGMLIFVEKLMTATPPRKIRQLKVRLELPHPLSPEVAGQLKEIALNCPVALSLNPDIKLDLDFIVPNS